MDNRYWTYFISSKDRTISTQNANKFVIHFAENVLPLDINRWRFRLNQIYVGESANVINGHLEFATDTGTIENTGVRHDFGEVDMLIDMMPLNKFFDTAKEHSNYKCMIRNDVFADPQESFVQTNPNFPEMVFKRNDLCHQKEFTFYGFGAYEGKELIQDNSNNSVPIIAMVFSLRPSFKKTLPIDIVRQNMKSDIVYNLILDSNDRINSGDNANDFRINIPAGILPTMDKDIEYWNIKLVSWAIPRQGIALLHQSQYDTDTTYGTDNTAVLAQSCLIPIIYFGNALGYDSHTKAPPSYYKCLLKTDIGDMRFSSGCVNVGDCPTMTFKAPLNFFNLHVQIYGYRYDTGSTDNFSYEKATYYNDGTTFVDISKTMLQFELRPIYKQKS